MYNIVCAVCNKLGLHVNLRYVHDTLIVTITSV
jgi:phage FluMu protein Com